MLLTFQLAYKYYKFSGGGVGGCKGDFNIELQSVSWLLSWLRLELDNIEFAKYWSLLDGPVKVEIIDILTLIARMHSFQMPI